MMTVFIDTNVYLDFLLPRELFEKDASEIFMLCEAGSVTGYTSSSAITDIAFMIRKYLGSQKVKPAIKDILTFSEIIETDKQAIYLAVNSVFRDFEDAVQHFSALKIPGVDFIITRNVSDFKHSLIPVISPRDFLRHLKNSSI